VVAAGCGTQPLRPPDPLAVRPPGGTVALRDPRSGLRFQAPRNWSHRIRTDPGMFRIASGAAEVSGWAYWRVEQLPSTRAQLDAARTALVKRARDRSTTFHLTGSSLTRVKGWPAIELRGTQQTLGRTLQTRSVHIFHNGEYVIEALAPPSDFALTDRGVLEPLLRSLVFRTFP
jgi:hypothetical protein